MKRRTVYFIRPIGMDGPVKIGCSISPTGRRETLETWSPYPLEIIAEIAGDFLIERRFHAHFADTYQRREWFGWSERIEQVVAAINAGTFDTGTLPDPTTIKKTYLKRKPWGEFSRKTASLVHRLRHAKRRSGLVPLDKTLCIHKAIRENNADALAKIEAFIADPASHGGCHADVYAEELKEWAERSARWRARQAELAA